MDRDKIIAKLNALRAKANNAGTPEEAATFMQGFNKLMQKYRMTETDLEVKSSKVEASIHTPKKSVSEIELVCSLIAKLTDTRAIKVANGISFIGLRADLEYANWIYSLVVNSIDRGLNALPLGVDYHRAINSGAKPANIKHNYKMGFLATVAVSLTEMIAANKVAGNNLVLVKQDIIQAFIDDNGGVKGGSAANVKLYTGEEGFALEGAREGAKVKLRQEVENPIKGYLK
jgi:hypothetical protein